MDKKIVTQKFGNRSKVERYSGGVNRGTDFGVAKGTPIAVPEGRWKIIEVYDKATEEGPNNRQGGINKGYGNSIVVKNLDTGEKMRFSHLSKVNTKSGIVEGGTVVGLSGATGNVAGKTGQHLDLEYFDSKGKLRDVMASRYANAPIIATGETSPGTVGGYATTNTGSTDKINMEETFVEKSKKFRLEARKRGWSEKKIDEYLDKQATNYEVKTGKVSAEDIEDPSERVAARETQKGMEIPVFTPKETIKETDAEVEGFMNLIDTGIIKDRESALKRYKAVEGVLDQKGVDKTKVLNVIDTMFPEELEQETIEEPTKDSYKDMFGYKAKPEVKKAADWTLDYLKKAGKGGLEVLKATHPVSQLFKGLFEKK